VKTQVTAPEVRAAALACAKSDVLPVEITWQLLKRLADHLDLVLDDNTRDGRLDLSRFTGQVRRELDKLVAAGELAKDINGRSARYWKPEAYRAHQDELAARRAEHEAACRFWKRISQEMALYGFQSTAAAGKPPQFSHDDWLRIIEAVEAARAAQGQS
jgi:hypothetical protein